MLLYRALDDVLPRFRALFAESNLTETQWRVLRILWQKEAIPLGELARIARISPPSLVGVIDRLEVKDLVTRSRSKADRRSVELALTPRGARLERKVRPRVAEIYREIDALLPPAQWKVFRALLDQLHSGLTNEDNQTFEDAG